MGYSDSRLTVERFRGFLANLEVGRSDSWHAKSLGYSAKDFAYKIREALYAASLNAEEYPALARARQLFEISILNPETVQATLKVKAPIHTQSKSLEGKSLPQEQLNLHRLDSAIKVAGKQSAASIIQLIIDSHADVIEQYGFPEASLSHDDAIRVRNWCLRQKPIWIFMMADSSVTIARESKSITPDLGWEPGE